MNRTAWMLSDADLRGWLQCLVEGDRTVVAPVEEDGLLEPTVPVRWTKSGGTGRIHLGGIPLVHIIDTERDNVIGEARSNLAQFRHALQLYDVGRVSQGG